MSPASPLTLLCVGRLGRHKGQEWLLEVYRQARSRFHRPARLVLVGRDEDAPGQDCRLGSRSRPGTRDYYVR